VTIEQKVGFALMIVGTLFAVLVAWFYGGTQD
jgi:hypothetical protein